jgi:3',5'-cyclic AMP phosphodiesterase CpdA
MKHCRASLMARALRPDVVVFLGDLVDGGRRYCYPAPARLHDDMILRSNRPSRAPAARVFEFRAISLSYLRYSYSAEELEIALRRFRRVFHFPKSIPVLHVPGNHDIGLGSSYCEACADRRALHPEPTS